MNSLSDQNQLITLINDKLTSDCFVDAANLLLDLKKRYPATWISQLKIREFLISKESSGKNELVAQKLYELLNTNTRFQKYLDEIRVVNLIFNDKNKLDSQEVLSSKNALKYYFGCLPYILKSAYKESLKNPHTLDFVLKILFDLFKQIYSLNNMKNKKTYRKLIFPFYRRKWIKAYYDYVYALSEWSNINVVYGYWRKDYYSFQIDESLVMGRITKEQSVKKLLNIGLEIENREREQSVRWRMNHSNEYQQLMPNKRFLSKEEKAITNHMFSFYFLDDNVIVGKVKLTEWIRAYYIIYMISTFRTKLGLLLPIRSSFFIRSKKWWLFIFKLFGISKESCRYLFDNMIYRENSSDFYDYPFIELYKEKFLVVSSAYSVALVDYILESRLNRNGAEPRIAGKSFELRIIDLLVTCGVEADSFMQKNGIQCDVAFVLDKDIYLCECKSRGRYRKDSNILDINSSDIDQITRIWNFYKNNAEIIRTKFQIKNKIDNVYRLVIYSEILDKSQLFEGVMFADWSMMSQYFTSPKKTFTSLGFRKYLSAYKLPFKHLNSIGIHEVVFKLKDLNFSLETTKIIN